MFFRVPGQAPPLFISLQVLLSFRPSWNSSRSVWWLRCQGPLVKGVHLLLWSQEVAVDAASFHRCWRNRQKVGSLVLGACFPLQWNPLHRRQLPANGDGRWVGIRKALELKSLPV